ncbi:MULTISPECIES: tautomerase family protein [unclassified Pseudomonas]|uniref:tautomerase family protein n=1 Tax=unclassified Pseudomonas TaxID=196821 RepID=UPI000BC420AD|nr:MULTISPECIES: tautomerase family protein [unclassified Pseudomonas]PVZ19897.1 4-oxalocrotonate tautomerase [Pseudomonas sp. URIL14HWK12:I12]PVZ26963.1 4-oxalocrotonate tautomerase [Pseudomonas sp. URIL14HWK12:I10]PVZ37852.1 4-oxalocrotonate tautomerase [Pseudomonas sp. URIL14HWK12:I11]SNZ05410.1 4-oxalocrotonate tautomerase [Pseudomonas sp. URIL14HWK12:I9]
MPGITLTLSGAPNPALASRLSNELTQLTARVLDKQPSQTMVIVQFVDPGLWYIDSESLESLGLNSFRLEVTVTDETTTLAQKKRYQRESYDLLSESIGNMHPHSNVHIIDVRAAAYGYGGVPQAERLWG